MELKRILRRGAALLLSALALAGPLAVPASRTSADSEFDIDGSAFVEPTYDTAMMYFWHKGLPSVTKDKQGNYIKYPVLIMWGDYKYFLCTDANFKEELNETHTLQKKKNSHYVFMGGYENNGYLSSDAFDHDDFDRVWGDTDYYMRYLYDMTDASLVSKLGLDINTLKTLGEAVSMALPSLPYLVATMPETDQYAIGLDEKVFGKDVWLVGRTRTWQKVPEDSWWGYDLMQEGQVQWGLDYESWTANKFCDKNYVYKYTRTMYDVNAHKGYDYSEGPDQHYWTIKQDSKGLYHFWTMGENTIASWNRISGTQGKEKNRQRTRDWYHANDVGRLNLYYSGSQIGASTPTVKNKHWTTRVNTIDNTDGYTIYYADPNIVSFHKQSFDVVNGQVVSLDGPRVIDNQCTITVHEGGVLACNGWVINNGQILVEPGGMLILDDRSTATGDQQCGAITSLGTDPKSGSGRIACDGIIIVNKDCKLTCAGVYGLQLGEGAQVVNYGQIITENLTVYGDHTIENRGDTSAVFAGWGVTDSGYALTRSKIEGQTYNGKGTLQKTGTVSVAKNAVYGDGASRFYVNGARTVSYEERENLKGYATGFVAVIGGTSFEDTPGLPPNIPIYHDDRYGVAYISAGGVVYQYDGMVGRWVNIENGSHETFFNYRMPDAVEEFVPGELPDGFILCDGRVVGQKVSEDLYYDHHAGAFWFLKDTVDYYYESQLDAYIHVEDERTYFRYGEEVAPPPEYLSSDYIPSDTYRDLPMGFRFYDSSMQEVQLSDLRPKVRKDGTGYYIIAVGIRLNWSMQDQLFCPEAGSMPEEALYDENGNRRGFTTDMVNLNGYNLSDPTAKPKVQADEYGYYIMYEGNSYRWNQQWQVFINGVPERYQGEWITKDQVDLNGYTLP